VNAVFLQEKADFLSSAKSGREGVVYKKAPVKNAGA